jgi:hypothetical protein
MKTFKKKKPKPNCRFLDFKALGNAFRNTVHGRFIDEAEETGVLKSIAEKATDLEDTSAFGFSLKEDSRNKKLAPIYATQ